MAIHENMREKRALSFAIGLGVIAVAIFFVTLALVVTNYIVPSRRAKLEETRKQNAEAERVEAEKRGVDLGNRVSYFQDQRTGFCYSLIMKEGFPSTISHTQVPCTEEVKKLIHEGVPIF